MDKWGPDYAGWLKWCEDYMLSNVNPDDPQLGVAAYRCVSGPKGIRGRGLCQRVEGLHTIWFEMSIRWGLRSKMFEKQG